MSKEGVSVEEDAEGLGVDNDDVCTAVRMYL